MTFTFVVLSCAHSDVNYINVSVVFKSAVDDTKKQSGSLMFSFSHL